MPYQEIEVAAELAISHNGINIYHTYKDDNINNGPAKYSFSLDEIDQGNTTFDVRMLPNAESIKPQAVFLNSPEYLNGTDAFKEETNAYWRTWHDSIEGEKIMNLIIENLDSGVIQNLFESK